MTQRNSDQTFTNREETLVAGGSASAEPPLGATSPIEEGVIKKITNGSGRYTPPPESVKPLLWHLQLNGIDLAAIDFYAITGREITKSKAKNFLVEKIKAPLEKWRRPDKNWPWAKAAWSVSPT